MNAPEELLILHQSDSWTTRVPCNTNQYRTLFTPPPFESTGSDDEAKRERKAKAICESCPAREEDCLQYTIYMEVDKGKRILGVIAGMTPRERQRLYKEKQDEK